MPFPLLESLLPLLFELLLLLLLSSDRRVVELVSLDLPFERVGSGAGAGGGAAGWGGATGWEGSAGVDVVPPCQPPPFVGAGFPPPLSVCQV